MPDRKGPGPKARRPAPGRPDPKPRYLDISSGYVDTTRLAPAAPPVPPRAPAALARAASPAPTVVGRGGLALASRPPAHREPEPPVMTRRQFEAEYQRLRRAFGDSAENPGSFRCQRCRSCANCMFCEHCEGCYRCTHCTRCQDASHLTHCTDCQNCHGSSYCVGCSNCVGSSYLTLCHACADCTYCFGCVGLSKKDFHILNVAYARNEYFRIVKALAAEMRL
ncbi:MAG TPA: caib/baif family protein [Anaeromyxobacteraceae bacterium]|nr:caib/baif family protein [Anaeromyxobacteraceae bacterium]